MSVPSRWASPPSGCGRSSKAAPIAKPFPACSLTPSSGLPSQARCAARFPSMSAWFEQPIEVAAAAPMRLCERVAEVASAELLPLVRSIDEGHYPEAVLRRLGEVGAFSPHASAPDGLFQTIEAMAAVGRHCLSTAFCVWCQDTFAWYLASTGNRELRERLLAGARSGSVLGGTGLSNPM